MIGFSTSECLRTMEIASSQPWHMEVLRLHYFNQEIDFITHMREIGENISYVKILIIISCTKNLSINSKSSDSRSNQANLKPCKISNL